MRLFTLSPVRTVAPADLAVSLAEAKSQLRIEDTESDAYITSLIDAATARVDGYSGILRRCLVNQTWRQDYPDFPSSRLNDSAYDRRYSGFHLLRLPFPDVQSVVVQYEDDDSATQTLSAASYHLVNDALGGVIVLADGATWPTTAEEPAAVSVTMVAGYGASSADVPAPIRHAILLHVTALFEDREGLIDGSPAYSALLAPYRRVG